MKKFALLSLLFVVLTTATAQDYSPKLTGDKLIAHKIEMPMTDGKRYPHIKFLDEEGNAVIMLTAHQFSNEKKKKGGNVTYEHKHFTIYAGDDSGGRRGVMDITYGHDKEQIQIENADLVLKDKKSSLLMRSPNGRYHKLVVENDGKLKTVPVSYSDIIVANVPTNKK